VALNSGMNQIKGSCRFFVVSGTKTTKKWRCHMKIQKVKISEINPAPYNPRINLKPGDPDYEKLKNSISTFGYVEPLVWNKRTGNLVSGHQRLKILLEKGIKEVEVSIVDLSFEKEKALNLALNKIRGDWDNDKLAVLLEELNTIPDFDVGLTGFDVPEVSKILDSVEEAKEDDFDFDSTVDSIEEPITKKGDLIELGPHRLLCGDSANIKNIKRLMGSEKANLLVTDPPYGVNYLDINRPNKQQRPKSSRKWDKIYRDDLSQLEYEKWLTQILTNITPYLLSGSGVYIWNGFRKFGHMIPTLTKLGFVIGCIITWAKPTFAISFGDYHQQTEFCFYGWKKGRKKGQTWYGPSNESTLWQIKRDLTKNYIHPTQKPLEIPARAIRNNSKRNDIVIDLFLGSGSTLIAAESLRRRCFGMEIEPKYVDGVIRRYISLVGEDKVSREIKKKYLKEEKNAK